MKITKVDDYLDRVCQKFPGIPKSDIKRILNYGLKRLYYLNSYGGDVRITSNDFWCYFGNLFKDSLALYKYYIRKLTIKLRVMYKVLNRKYSGYYYFALTEKQYRKYLSQKDSKFRPRKWVTFENIMLYKMREECRIRQTCGQYIFKVAYPIDLGFKVFQKTFKTDSEKLIEYRPIQKFKDILTSNYNYKYE